MRISDKYFMNLQEAVGWLLDNNFMPFQSTASYVADTEIAKNTIINPAPIDVKVGSLVLFSDCKIGTVSGVGSNYFIVGPLYTDIKDATVSIANLAINGSGKLIVTLTDGSTVDAGRIKMISNFAIDASQNLIANYNDGTSQNLGSLGDYSNVDFIAKTLSQTNPNYSDSLVLAGQNGLTVDNIYNRLEVINNILYFVINVKVTNNTASDIIVGGDATSQIAYRQNTFPSAIGDKIVDIEGKKISEVATNKCIIVEVPAIMSENSVFTSGPSSKHCLFVLANRDTANSAYIYLTTFERETITVGSSRYFFARVALTLI